MTREKVEEWLEAMEKTSICGLGQASPIPVRNAMRWWPDLFEPLGADGVPVSAVVEFTLDGRTVCAPEGELLVHAAARHGVSSRRSATTKLDPVRRLPHVRRRRRGLAAASAGLRDPRHRGHGRLDELPEPSSADADRDAARRAPQRQPGGRPNELLDLAEELGQRRRCSSPSEREPYDDRNRLMGYDPDACILCARCVRYTQEVMQCSALSLEGRGGPRAHRPHVGPSWLDTECELCGGCLSVCPTGAIYEKFVEGAPARAALEQVRTTCTFCGVGCQIDLNVDPETQRIVKVTRTTEYVSNEGNLCVKGRFAFNFVHHPDRLTEPLVRGEDGELHPTTWEHALESAAAGLGVIESARAAGGRRPRLGAPDERGELPDPEARADGGRDELRPLLRSHLTRSHSLRPGQVVRQRSKHQLDPGDRERPFLLVIGSNTTEAHPVLALRMKKAVRKGATLVVADPRKIWLTKLAKRHLQLRPGPTSGY